LANVFQASFAVGVGIAVAIGGAGVDPDADPDGTNWPSDEQVIAEMMVPTLTLQMVSKNNIVPPRWALFHTIPTAATAFSICATRSSMLPV